MEILINFGKRSHRMRHGDVARLLTEGRRCCPTSTQLRRRRCLRVASNSSLGSAAAASSPVLLRRRCCDVAFAAAATTASSEPGNCPRKTPTRKAAAAGEPAVSMADRRCYPCSCVAAELPSHLSAAEHSGCCHVVPVATGAAASAQMPLIVLTADHRGMF